jgi:hypothetical protein
MLRLLVRLGKRSMAADCETVNRDYHAAEGHWFQVVQYGRSFDVGPDTYLTLLNTSKSPLWQVFMLCIYSLANQSS